MNVSELKIQSLWDDLIRIYLGPLFLLFNCLTIKSEVFLHHMFSAGFVVSIGLMTLHQVWKDKSFSFLFKGKKFYVWLFVLGAWMALSAFLSDHPQDSLKSVLRANLFFIAVYLLSIFLVTERQINAYIFTLIITGIIVSLSIVLEFGLSLKVFDQGEVVRYSGIIKAPNVAGYIIAICTLLIFPWLKKFRYLIIFVMINTAALVLTSSRSAWMMFGIAAGLYMISRFKFKEYKGYYIVIFLVALIVGLVFYGQIYDLARFKYGITYRDYLWLGAVRMFLDNPVFGVGSGNFQYYISDYIQGVDKGSDIWLILSYGFTHAHSLLLTNFAELGLPGGLIVMGLLITLIIHYFRNRKKMDTMRLILAAIFIGFIARIFFESGGFLSNGWFAVDIYLWLVIIFSLNLFDVERSKL